MEIDAVPMPSSRWPQGRKQQQQQQQQLQASGQQQQQRGQQQQQQQGQQRPPWQMGSATWSGRQQGLPPQFQNQPPRGRGRGKGAGRGQWTQGSGQNRPRGQGQQGPGGGKGGGRGDGSAGQQQAQQQAPRVFQGYCNLCGRWGHRQRECRAAVLSLGTLADPPTIDVEQLGASAVSVAPSASAVTSPPVRFPPITTSPSTAPTATTLSGPPIAASTTRRLMVVATLASVEGEQLGAVGEICYVMVDSGAYDHVCPMQFAMHFGTEESSSLGAVGADGTPLMHYGVRRVWAMLENGREVEIRFQVMGVARPILSVSRLATHGYIAHFHPEQSVLSCGEEQLGMVSCGGLYYLPLCVLGLDPVYEDEVTDQKCVCLDAPQRVCTPVCAVRRDVWHLFEYACSEDSLLGQWFENHGHVVRRLGLPNTDLSSLDVVTAVSIEARQILQAGGPVFLWVSLPCSAWSNWQRINLKGPGAQRILARQRESVWMFELLVQWCVPLLRAYPELMHAALEWPRYCEGWRKMPLMPELRRFLQFVCRFDGCRYNLRGRLNKLVRKPWQLITTLESLVEPLSLVCSPELEHDHEPCRGLAARMSSYYTWELVDAVGQSVAASMPHFVGPLPQIPVEPLCLDAASSSGIARDPATGRALDEGAGMQVCDDDEPLAAERVAVAPDDVDVDRHAAQQPVAVPAHLPLVEPTPAERASHNLVHTPFAPWCRLCIMGQAKDRPHHLQAREVVAEQQMRVPQVEVDYCFLGTSLANDVLMPILVGIERRHGHGFAHVAKTKGRSDGVVVTAFLRWLTDVGLTGDAALRCDPEPAVTSFCQEVGLRRAPALTILQQTPVESPSSKGAVERYIQSVEGKCRTFRVAVQERWHTDVNNSSAIFPWLVRHSAWVLERYMPGPQGVTPYASLHQQPYTSQVCEFSEPVLIRLPSATSQPKFEARWQPGLWLGKLRQADSHLVGTPDGVVSSRTIRPMSSADVMPSLFTQMTWTPWRLRGTSEVIPQPTPSTTDASGANLRAGLAPSTLHAEAFEAFLRECGPTPSCTGCREPGAHSHNLGCWARRRAWERRVKARAEASAATAEAGEETTTTPPTTPFSSSMPTSSPLGPSEVIPSTPPAELEASAAMEETPAGGEKRGRDPVAEEEAEMEEILARALREQEDEDEATMWLDEVGCVARVCGPPWFSDVDGAMLDPDEVKKGMEAELAALQAFSVFQAISRQEARERGATIVSSRWVLRNKPTAENPRRVKARLVARQFSRGAVAADVYAATPTPVGQRLLLERSLERGWPTFLIDVSTAFLHATIPEDMCICIEPPEDNTVSLVEVGMLLRCLKACEKLLDVGMLVRKKICVGRLRRNLHLIQHGKRFVD